MYSGMTRREVRGLAVLIVLAALGVGARQFVHRQEMGNLWVEVPTEKENRVAAKGASLPDPSPASLLTREKLDINQAELDEMAEKLPGIGPAKAQAIVTYREQHGGFQTLQQLEDVPGIGPKTLERLLPLLTLTPAKTKDYQLQPAQTPAPPPAPSASASPAPTPKSPPPKTAPAKSGLINLNTATAEQLQELNGIGEVMARRILEDRRLNGPFRSVEEWTRVKGIGPKTLEKNRHRLTVR